MDQMVNNIQSTWKLALMLKTYKTCNSTVRFSKYEFYNKYLGGVKQCYTTLHNVNNNYATKLKCEIDFLVRIS